MIAFVLIGTISELLNISSKQVSKLINSLKAKGYIDVTMKYKDNLFLQQELTRQVRMVEKAERYQMEREKIIADNKDMHNQLDKMKFSYNQKERDLEWTYKHKINKLENENNYLKFDNYKIENILFL